MLQNVIAVKHQRDLEITNNTGTVLKACSCPLLLHSQIVLMLLFTAPLSIINITISNITTNISIIF